MSNVFFDTALSLSLSAFKQWILTDPITADGSILALYKQVELVILSFGLALRVLWVA
jgi:hypothetical protein